MYQQIFIKINKIFVQIKKILLNYNILKKDFLLDIILKLINKKFNKYKKEIKYVNYINFNKVKFYQFNTILNFLLKLYKIIETY